MRFSIRTLATIAALALVSASALPTTLAAQPAVMALIPVVMPDVEKARTAVAEHPTLATFEIEDMLRKRVDAATAAFTVPQSGAAVRAALQPLEKDLGPLRTVPYAPPHQLLGAVAGAEGRDADQICHRAYGVAVLIAIDRSGDGKTLPTAMRVVMVNEQYTWFRAQRDMQAKTRRSCAKTAAATTCGRWRRRRGIAKSFLTSLPASHRPGAFSAPGSGGRRRRASPHASIGCSLGIDPASSSADGRNRRTD